MNQLTEPKLQKQKRVGTQYQVFSNRFLFGTEFWFPSLYVTCVMSTDKNCALFKHKVMFCFNTDLNHRSNSVIFRLKPAQPPLAHQRKLTQGLQFLEQVSCRRRANVHTFVLHANVCPHQTTIIVFRCLMIKSCD